MSTCFQCWLQSSNTFYTADLHIHTHKRARMHAHTAWYNVHILSKWIEDLKSTFIACFVSRLKTTNQTSDLEIRYAYNRIEIFVARSCTHKDDSPHDPIDRLYVTNEACAYDLRGFKPINETLSSCVDHLLILECVKWWTRFSNKQKKMQPKEE